MRMRFLQAHISKLLDRDESQEFQVYAILSSGRSGSTLLRNEIAKPREVGALASEAGYSWHEQNREMLRQLDAVGINRCVRALRKQWQEAHFYEHEVKYLYAKRGGANQLPQKLLLKFPLFAFGHAGLEDFATAIRVFYLCRHPMDVAVSFCKPLWWNGNEPMWSGKRLPLFQKNMALLDAFARAEGVPGELRSWGQLQGLPYHVAVAHYCRGFHEVLAHVVSSQRCRSGQLFLRFEDLVEQRDATLTRIADFMGIQDRSYLANSKFYREVEEEGGIRMNVDTARPSPERGYLSATEFLDYSQLSEMKCILGQTANRLGYSES